MSPTEESSESLSTFLPSSWIYNDFDQTAVDKMMALQRQHWKRGHGSNVFLLLDDCMYDRGIFRGDTGKTFRQLFMNGRKFYLPSKPTTKILTKVTWYRSSKNLFSKLSAVCDGYAAGFARGVVRGFEEEERRRRERNSKRAFGEVM
jgi:hypothetical protein